MQLLFSVFGLLATVELCNGIGAPKTALSFIQPNRMPAKGYEKYKVTGVVRMTQKMAGMMTVMQVAIEGLKPNTPHGFHIHQYGDIYTKGCQSTGSHYNPFHKQHGGPTDTNRHVGDLGNVMSDEKGKVKVEIKDHLVSLYGPYTVYGRAFVLHALKDDLGKGKGKARAESLKSGNAGARLACGIIADTPVKMVDKESEMDFVRSDSITEDDDMTGMKNVLKFQ